EADDPEFSYSVLFEMSLYALKDVQRIDSALAGNLREQWHPRVRDDFRELKEYLERNRNTIEPFINRFYDNYLKMNEQPKGYRTYNEVIRWLIAYRKKSGALP
ncbi:MAG TPA: DUF3810 family protein, partial [Flavisolibacter sp.]